MATQDNIRRMKENLKRLLTEEQAQAWLSDEALMLPEEDGRERERFILSDGCALRSWDYIPFAVYRHRIGRTEKLSFQEFLTMIRCDGETEIPVTKTVEDLLSRGLIRKSTEGETPDPWQEYRVFDNRFVPAMCWMITGKCNYNCLHCFNASDNAPLMSSFTLEEALRLLDDAEACGIQNITLTGGEPMLHPHFREITEEIYRRHIYIKEINTNGAFLNEESLDHLAGQPHKPLMKISFDGLGFHDWMRNHPGAEKRTQEAISRCIRKGFPVMVQMNINRMNIGSLLPTLEWLDSMHVEITRVIRTSESPRWVQNAPGNTLSIQEYFDGVLDALKQYADRGHQMPVRVWHFLSLYPKEKTILFPLRHSEKETDLFGEPACLCSRAMLSVAADGEVYPCLQMSGFFEAHGWHLGNVKNGGLKSLLQDGAYLKAASITVRDLIGRNPECAKCRWLSRCAGGCRAMSLIRYDDYFGKDYVNCIFFKEGYEEKIQKAFPEWNIS